MEVGTPCFGLELALDEVFFTGELRFEVLDAYRGGFFAFEYLESHICGAKVPAYAYQVVGSGAIASYNF